jgi:trehalose 6-phosphate phosphatase
MNHVWDEIPAIASVIAQRPLGLFTDVDGTIAEIVAVPGEAKVAAGARGALVSLCKELEAVAVVSGRSARDAYSIVDVDRAVYYGNHGLEELRDGQLRAKVRDVAGTRRAVAEACELICNDLISVPGLVFENKGLSIAVHYRQSLEPDRVAQKVLDAAERFASPMGLAVRLGRMVVEVYPKEASKGAVVASLVRRARLRGAIYIGDDVTDADAFLSLHVLQEQIGDFVGLSVAARFPESSEGLLNLADLVLDGVPGVVEFLEWLEKRLTRPNP